MSQARSKAAPEQFEHGGPFAGGARSARSLLFPLALALMPVGEALAANQADSDAPAELSIEAESASSASSLPTPEALEHLRVNTGYVLDKGELEFNLVGRHLDVREGAERTYALETQYGVRDDLMLELELVYGETDLAMPGGDSQEFQAIELGVKFLLLDTRLDSLSLVTDLEYLIDAPGPEPGGDDIAAEVSLAWSRFLFEGAATLSLELGSEWEEAEGVEETFFNAALDAHGGGTRVIYFQQGLNVSAGEITRAVLIPGIQLAPESSIFKLGVGVAVGLTDESEDWGVAINLEVEFD